MMTKTFTGVALTGTGSAVPDITLTNDDLAQVVETCCEQCKYLHTTVRQVIRLFQSHLNY